MPEIKNRKLPITIKKKNGKDNKNNIQKWTKDNNTKYIRW